MQGKQCTIWMMLMVIILLAGGCSRVSEEERAMSAESAADVVYSANTLPVYEYIVGSVQDIIVQHGRLGIVSLEWLDDTYTKCKRHFYVMDTVDAAPLEILVSLPQTEMLQAYTLDSNGNLIYIMSTDDTEASTMQFVKVDMSGKELVRKTLHFAERDIREVLADAEGRVYLVQAHTVMVMDADFEMQATLRGGSEQQTIDSVAFSADGRLICGWRDFDTEEKVLHVFELGDAGFEWGNSYDIVLKKTMTDDQLLMSGWDVYDFCYKDQDGVYGYMTGSGASVRLMDYTASGVAEDETWKLRTLTKETYISVMYEDAADPQVVVYCKVDPEVLARRKNVVVGVFGVDEDVRNAVVQFNRSHTEYQVALQDYLEAEDPVLQINTEIAAGNALTQNGKMYYVAPQFTLYTIAARGSDVGANVGWTMQDMQEVVSRHKGTAMFYLRSKTDVLYTLLEMQVSDYVDWSNGTCSFDSEMFRTLLELVNNDGVEMPVQQNGGLKEELGAIQNGQVMFWEGCVDLARLYMNRKAFGGDVTYVGYPNASREGTYIQFQHPYAIYSGSKEKQAAWEFIRIFMTKKYQGGMELYGSAMPTRQDCFDLMIEGNLAQESYVNEMGQNVIPGELWSMYSMVYNGTQADGNPITKEDADVLCALVNQAKKAVSYEDGLMRIIQEEAQTYFAGDRELEDTVRKIQKRAELYVNENR